MRTIKGIVTSDKMNKTIIVSVYSYKSHPKYKKKYRVTKKFYVHDEDNVCVIWDNVTIKESRPLSRLKRWEIQEIEGKEVTPKKTEITTPEKVTEKKAPAKKVPEKKAPVKKATKTAKKK